MQKTVYKTVTRTGTGLPCMCESGGAYNLTGIATIVCGSSGRRKKPVIIHRNPDTNGDHAIFALAPKDHVIEVKRSKDSYELQVLEFVDAIDNNGVFKLLKHKLFDRPELTDVIKEFNHLSTPIMAAVEKSQMVRCRQLVYGNAPLR